CYRYAASPSLFPFAPSPTHLALHPSPTRRSSDLFAHPRRPGQVIAQRLQLEFLRDLLDAQPVAAAGHQEVRLGLVDLDLDVGSRSEEHTSELQSPYDLVCRLLLEKKKMKTTRFYQ